MNWSNLTENEPGFSLKHRVLNIIITLGIVMAVVNIIFNYVFGFTMTTIICTIVFLVLLGCFYLSVFRRNIALAMPLVVSIIFVITPFIWIYNGGMSGGTSFFVLIFSPIILILFSGIKRVLLLGFLVIMTLTLIVMEYNNVFAVVGYLNNFDRYADYTFSLIMAIIVNAFLYEVFLNYYNREYKRAREYEEEIERKSREVEMIRLDRLHLVGEIAASIGHEVRNPLTTVRGFLQLMQKRGKYRDDKEYFSIMLDELDRANMIITEFLSLARDKAIKLEVDNLNRIISVILPLLQADSLRLGKRLQIELSDIPDLMLDENEIRQCIFNFIRNGFEAVGSDGLVTLKTFLDNDSVILAIQDNGAGIPADIYKKLGTPFISTKPQGTGLGIPICYKIAQRHNARIDVETGPAGTVFSVRFRIPQYDVS